MKRGRASLLLLAALLLGGCVMQPSATRPHAYQDGSYYAPAGDGHGDYYYAPERRDDPYPPMLFYPGFGWPYGSIGGGYCPARYRFCPSWYRFGFGYGGALYYGWNDPFLRFGYPTYPRPRHRRNHPTPPPGGWPSPGNGNRPVTSRPPPILRDPGAPAPGASRPRSGQRESRNPDPGR